MDPSHVRRYEKAEIEAISSRILSETYATGINVPVEIDWIAENHELVDNIIPIELLEDKFNVAAALVSKPNGHVDILVDDDAITFQEARANFSVAHEFGHVILHQGLYSNCDTLEKAIGLRDKIKTHYSALERNTNYFAGSILIPRRTLFEDTARVYEGIVKTYGYDVEVIPSKLYSTLARRYRVNPTPMRIRLEQTKLIDKVVAGLNYRSPYLDP